MPQTLVLIGFAEALAAPEVAWSLVDAGFAVVAFARRGRSSALRHSRLVTCHEICPPETDLDAALADLHSIMRSLRGAEGSQTVLFPLDDTAVWLASRVKPESGWLLAGPQGRNVELALNKCHQLQFAREAGFAVPRTACARTASDALAFSNTESFPLILKPVECVPVSQGKVRSCRKWICANDAELQRALAEWKEQVPLLMQPFIVGTGEGVFGIAAESGIRAWSGHRRLRMMNPQGSGSSACISQGVPDDVRSKAEGMIESSGWRGLFMIELLRDQSGKLWFVELNGRPWGSISLSRRQGLEYPAWQVQLAMDPQSQVGLGSSSEPGLVCRHVGREFMHLLFALRGPRSRALSEWPPFWKTLGDLISVRPGDTFYNWRRQDSDVFFADVYNTIKDNLFKARN